MKARKKRNGPQVLKPKGVRTGVGQPFGITKGEAQSLSASALTYVGPKRKKRDQ